jgi:tRNA threonylcarbamoyladenosine biosynthesis protein TsaE
LIRYQTLPEEASTLALGHRLAGLIDPPFLIHLRGELGAGKTTLARGLLRGLGYNGPVRSPSFSLLESYDFPDRTVHHLDLYRIADPGELEAIGFRELFDPTAIVVVEWPERAEGCLPSSDLEIRLAMLAEGARRARLLASSARGRVVLAGLRRRRAVT